MADETPASAAKPTAVEVAKTASNFLRGDIAKELVDGAAGFGKGSIQLLKNHGTYQQDDREARSGSGLIEQARSARDRGGELAWRGAHQRYRTRGSIRP